MNVERAACAMGGACIAFAACGACAALTAIPPWIMASCGAILIAICGPRRCAVSAAAGACIAVVLPAAPQRAAGVVITRSPHAVVRNDLFDVLDRLDADPAGVMGTRVTVGGVWAPARDGSDATVSRRIMNCCAADAVDIGFDVESARVAAVAPQSWVRVTGVVGERMRDGESRFVLLGAKVERAAPDAR